MIAMDTLSPPEMEKMAWVFDHLSPSSIKDYLGCPLRFFFARVEGLPQPTSPALHLGKVVHAGIEWLNHRQWRDEEFEEADLIAFYREAFERLQAEEGPVGYADTAACEKSMETGERVLLAFARSDVYKSAGRPRGVEVSASMLIPGHEDLRLVGYIDRVDGENRPTDYKTCAATPNVDLELFLHRIQLIAYEELVEAATNEPCPGSEVIFLVKTKTPKVIRAQAPRTTDQERERFWTLVTTVIEGVQAERFHPSPGQHCSWCSFRSECSKWTGGAS